VDDGVLQAMFALEYATLFDVIKNGLSNLRFPMPLGGTSNHFRTETLKRVGGWDAWNVTEDAELGLRFARLGLRTERLQSVTYEEAPPTLKAWFNQRRRWSKGWMQTAIAHSAQPIENIKKLGFLRVAQSFLMITGSVFCMLMFPLGVLAFTLRCFNGHDFFCGGYIDASIDALSLIVAVLGALALFLPSIIALKKRKLERFWWIIPLIPLYLVGVTCASWMAAFDLMVRPFHWIKTEHGFAKTSNRIRV
jgi:glycosyltransferase XagB